jgi:hypothetical protein
VSQYTAVASRALASVKRKGVAVTFAETVRTHDGATETFTASVVTVAGYAVRIPARPDTYERLGLIQSTAPTLLFTPATYGEVPALGATVSWSGKTLTVADVNPLEPDGTVILAEVVVR